MSQWQPIEGAPTAEWPNRGLEVIGWGFPGWKGGPAYPDTRVIKGSRTKDGKVLWSARNDFGEFPVGFLPLAWMPKPPDPQGPQVKNDWS